MIDLDLLFLHTEVNSPYRISVFRASNDLVILKYAYGNGGDVDRLSYVHEKEYRGSTLEEVLKQLNNELVM